MTGRNLSRLVPKEPFSADRHVWAVVTQSFPLRIRIDGETTDLPFSPDSIVIGLRPGDRVLALLWSNPVPSSRSHRVVIIGKSSQVVTPNVQTFTSSGTWNNMDGATTHWTRAIGAGGAGGGAGTTAAGQAAAGGGGGGGGYAEEWKSATDYGSSVAVTIGVGGTPGTAGANNGNSGGTTTFGSFLQATGGVGGNGSGAAVNQVVQGGAGGVGSLGDVNLQGGAGDNGRSMNGTVGAARGGNSLMGAGAPQANSVNTQGGLAGQIFGGGGSGAINRDTGGVTNQQGGAGANGGIIVVTFFN